MASVDGSMIAGTASPRRTHPWAKSYKDRAERLVATGAMQSAGLASMQQAQATGA